jgi:hypothetical protein
MVMLFFIYFYNIMVNGKLGKEQIIEMVMCFKAGQIAWINSQGTHLELIMCTLLVFCDLFINVDHSELNCQDKIWL